MTKRQEAKRQTPWAVLVAAGVLGAAIGLAVLPAGAEFIGPSATYPTGGFVGPGATGAVKDTVAYLWTSGVSGMPVTLTGQLLSKVGPQHYVLRDTTGDIVVEIDDRLWLTGLTVTPQDAVVVSGRLAVRAGGTRVVETTDLIVRK